MAYVDKTASIYRLAQRYQYVFLSRPRRFGKSLILSTLASYFAGQRELFDGLALAELEQNWEVYPTIRIDLSQASYLEIGALADGLLSIMRSQARRLNVELVSERAGEAFNELIDKLAVGGRKVVILIDEYDKPLVNVLHKPELFTSNREALAAFYGIMKSRDEQLRFVMLTGISRFAKTGVF